ncbi:hypothetical protein IKE71_00190 [Candidatus Saccharibacteria bacterium]|nr:hypothetical protein [Candidatus Saccharibacteria bacterium]
MQPTRTTTLTDAGNDLKNRGLYRRLFFGSLASLFLFIFSFILIPALIAEASATNLVGVGANWAVISLTLDPDYEATQSAVDPSAEQALATHGNIDFGEITPTAKASGISNSSFGNVGTLEIQRKVIRVDTTGNYYQVFLSTADDESNALKNNTNSYITIPAISSDGTNSGAWSSPAYFSAQGWGYAVTGDTEAITLPTFFTASTAAITSSLGNELTYMNDEAVYSGVKFSAVPLLSSPQQIYKNTTNVVGGFSDNNADTFNVYYGVMVNTDVLSGTYSNQIIYTALASAASLDEVSTNVYVEKYIIAKDVEQEISFDLAASTIPSNITAANTHVYLVPHSEMLAAGNDGYDIEELAGYANPASHYNECEVTSINIAEDKSTLLCDSPESSNGTADDLTNGTNGMFDYWIQISGLNFNYVSKTADGSETVAYIGLQSTYEEENETTGETETKNYVTEMQEMTGAFCKNTNMWGTGTSDDARIYDNLGEDGNNPLLAAGTDTVGISSFLLTDNRDQKDYKVRRLADGNCWMAEELNLDVASVNISDTNTDNPTAKFINEHGTNSESCTENATACVERVNYLTHPRLTGALEYNYYTATAGTVGYSNTDATGSICSSNWRLPTAGGSGTDFYELITGYYSIAANEPDLLIGLPLSFQDGRFIYASSSHTTNVITAGDLFYDTSEDRIVFSDQTAKFYWSLIRCVARD